MSGRGQVHSDLSICTDARRIPGIPYKTSLPGDETHQGMELSIADLPNQALESIDVACCASHLMTHQIETYHGIDLNPGLSSATSPRATVVEDQCLRRAQG